MLLVQKIYGSALDNYPFSSIFQLISLTNLTIFNLSNDLLVESINKKPKPKGIPKSSITV